MSDDSGDSNKFISKSAASETVSSNEETIIPKACIQLAESGPSGVPSRLQTLCDRLTKQTPTALITAALQLLMLESGFVLPPSSVTHEEISQSNLVIQCETTKKGGYENIFIFTLREVIGCECKLMITSMEDVILVNSLTNVPVAAYSVVLPVKYYVPHPDAPILSQKYNHLDELSLTFKNSIATPARAAVLAANGIAAASLVGLPLEILYNILEYCDPISVCRVALTCRALSISAREQHLWYFFCKKHFPSKVIIINQHDNVDWRNEYRMACRPQWKPTPNIIRFAKMTRV